MNQTDWKIIFRWSLIAIEKHSLKWYERAVRPPGVRLILKNSQGKYLITKEFRHEQWGFDFRLPWGKVFDDLESYLQIRHNETDLEKSVLEAARIEAKEEAGIDEIKDLQIIHTSFAGASVEWTLYYLSWDIVSESEQNLAGEELVHGIEIGFYTKQEILKMIQDGDINEERSVAVLVRYLEVL